MEEALRRKLLELSTKQASLNFRIYELFTYNRTLAMRLSGYAAENRSLGGDGVSEEVQKIIDKYLVKKMNGNEQFSK